MINRIAPFFLEVAQGDIEGHSHIHKFGQNTAVGTTFETIWDQGVPYSYLTTATTLKISSSDTNDTSAGTGARTVQIYGLDANHLEIDETITLNGQTEVTSVNSYLRIFRMIVRSAGSGDTAAGDIYAGTGTVTLGVPASVYAKIGVGNNQTLMAMYTIPAGKTAYLIEKWGGTSRDKETTFNFAVKPEGEVFQVKQVDAVYQTQFFSQHKIQQRFEAKTDIEMQVKIDTGSATVTAGFDLLLVDN